MSLKVRQWPDRIILSRKYDDPAVIFPSFDRTKAFKEHINEAKVSPRHGRRERENHGAHIRYTLGVQRRFRVVVPQPHGAVGQESECPYKSLELVGLSVACDQVHNCGVVLRGPTCDCLHATSSAVSEADAQPKALARPRGHDLFLAA